MTSVVTFVRFLESVNGRMGSVTKASTMTLQQSNSSGAFRAPGQALVSRPRWGLTRSRNVGLFTAGCLGIFLGGFDEKSLIIQETGSSAPRKSSYHQVELKEVPKSLDPRYRSLQE